MIYVLFHDSPDLPLPVIVLFQPFVCVQLWLNREREKYHRRQVRKVLKETRVDAVAAAETTSTRTRTSIAQPGTARDG